MTDRELLDAAEEARRRAYCPYSGFGVGAAVLDENGNIHRGCNVENASYPEGQCAEANAIGAMVAAGGTRIVAIAIVGGVTAGGEKNRFHSESSCTPCGGCRQRIREFADDDSRILTLNEHGEPIARGIAALLPDAFGSP